jgi:hypothetical protein
LRSIEIRVTFWHSASRPTAQITTQAVCNRGQSSEGAVGQEIMKHWIAELAGRERERQKTVDQIQDAAPGFIGILAVALREDAKVFHNEFPHSAVNIITNEAECSIALTCSAYKPATEAAIQMEVNRQCITCAYRNVSPEHANWSEAIHVSQGGIHTRNLSPEQTAVMLSEKILGPVLFPNL